MSPVMFSLRRGRDSRSSSRLTLLCGLTLVLLQLVSGGGEFQLLLSSFRNDEGLAADGLCCESDSGSTIGRCSSPCRTFFRVCLSHYLAQIPPDVQCTFGESRTDVIIGNSFDIPLTGLESQGRSNESLVGLNPIRIPFSFTWLGYFTIIVEAYHDMSRHRPAPGSPRRLIWRHATQHQLEAGSEWQNVTSSTSATGASSVSTAGSGSGSASLSFGYRVLCTGEWYGPKCDTQCRERDDGFGHSTCNRTDGSRICYSGWTGQYCDKPICLTGCSNKTGKCNEPNECRCFSGWQGARCDECVPLPGCLHGTCQQAWECSCLPGWGGQFCNQDLDLCTTNRPCRNGATCRIVGDGGYECMCRPGFSGVNCQIEASDCTNPETPCYNGGTCFIEDTDSTAAATTQRASSTGSGNLSTVTEAQCRCPPGWRGARCESRVADTCDDRPCRNGGACVAVATRPNRDGVMNYECSCAAGFSGANCETEIDECASQPCLNGGRCIDDVDRFRCVCPAGFSGIVCQTNVDDCAARPCLNDAECIDEVNGFQCRCPLGFSGALCQLDVDECASSPCGAGSTCRNLVGSFRCTCPPGYGGPTCTARGDESDLCRSSPCLNGATCVERRRSATGSRASSAVSGDSYMCRCASGYFGRWCEHSTTANDTSEINRLQTTDELQLSKDDRVKASSTPIFGSSSEDDGSTTAGVFFELVLIVGLGVLAPLSAIGFTVAVVIVVRSRRRRRQKLRQRSSTAAIFIENATSSGGVSNNRLTASLSTSRDNHLNAAVASSAAVAGVHHSRKLLDDSESSFVRYDERTIFSKASESGFPCDVGSATLAGGMAAVPPSCTYVKLTNHQHQQQREQQQQQLLLEQQRHHSNHQRHNNKHSQSAANNIYRPQNNRSSVYAADQTLSLLSSNLVSSSAHSVVTSVKTSNMEPRRCHRDRSDEHDVTADEENLKAAAVDF